MSNKIYRSQTDKMLSGVCGGLAEKFNIDSSLVRLIFVLLAIFGGHGLLIYVILWLILPVAPDNRVIDVSSHPDASAE
ncbi:MAG: PspC domain-containing protein [Anaerolineae bacterium]|nr:PspC domain-containing protein [Anaerolineae bacterium]